MRTALDNLVNAKILIVNAVWDRNDVIDSMLLCALYMLVQQYKHSTYQYTNTAWRRHPNSTARYCKLTVQCT
jgi:hypothetical protein